MTTGSKKVIVADDDPAVREIVAEYLTLHGYEVLQAENGLEALLHIKHTRPAAVLLDLRMPRLGGLDALKRISVFDPRMAVIVITGETDPIVHARALALGARIVLEKPVPLGTLLATLAGATGQPVPAAAPAPAPAPVAPPPMASKDRVLVVDDDAEVRAMLGELLTHRGYEVSSAADGVSALAAIAERPPAVVLLDLEMPGLRGLDALPAIRALAPATAVIMVSGVQDTELARRALAHGAFDYIVKPPDLQYLTQSLEAALAFRVLGS